MERYAAEPDQAARIGGDHLRHAVVEHALELEALLRLRPVGALLHEARGEHLHVDAHGVHPGDALGRVGHARLDEGVAVAHHLRAASLMLGSAFDFTNMLCGRGHRIHLRDHEMGVHVDGAGPPPRFLVNVHSGLPGFWGSSVKARRRCKGKICRPKRSATSPHTPRGANSMMAIATAPSISR